MDNFGMLRSPNLTPMAVPEPKLQPPPLSDCEVFVSDDSEELQIERSHSGYAVARTDGIPTELDLGPDGHVHLKKRHYKRHSPTITGRLLDFIGVPTHLTIGGMIWSLVSLFIPATATTILYFSNQAITMMFVGQMLGVKELAHYAVGISVFNICGLSLGLGMATALDTLCSQAYGRNPHGPEVGIILQRGLLICLGLAVPVVGLFFCVEPLLIDVFGASLGRGVALFLRSSHLYLFALIGNFCLQKALQAQHLPSLAVWANIASGAMCPIFNLWLTPHGVPYAVLAVALSVIVAIAVMAVGAAFHPRSVVRKAPWPSSEAFSWDGAKEFIVVGVPGMMSVVSEWWAFEFLIAFSSKYGENVVTAFTICMNILTFMFAVPSGLSVAAGVMCGNFLGANDPRGAQSFARIALVLVVCLIAAVDGLLLMFGSHVFSLYTKDKHVQDLMRNVLLLLAVFHCGDALQSVMQGVFRGAGRQAMSARIVLASLWLIGLPTSWYLGSTMEPLDGILTGLVIGFAVEIPMLAFDMLFRWDWEQLAEAAAKTRLAEEAEHHHLTSDAPAGYGTV